MDDAQSWIRELDLRPHPEGGWYREIYRATETVPHAALPSRFDGARPFSTAIYFLLTADAFSALHRIRQDELWHFYAGDSLTLHMIGSDGVYSSATVGRHPPAGERPVRVVPAGVLFGATVEPPGSYALVGCTVAPGFDFSDLELPSREELLRECPQHAPIVERLTRSG